MRLLSLLGFVGALAAIVVYVAASPPTRTAFDLADPPTDVTLRGFYGPERNEAFTFRWARPAASLSIPTSAPGDYRITVGVGDNPTLSGGRRVRFFANGQDLGTVTTGGSRQDAWFVVRLDADTWLISGRALHLEVESPEVVPPDDPRPLGPFFTTVRVEPQARRFPAPLAILAPFAFLFCLALALHKLRVARRWLVASLGGGVAILALFAALRREDALAMLIALDNPSLLVPPMLVLSYLLLSSEQHEPVAAQPGERRTWVPWLALAAIVVVGAGLRSYRLVELAPFLGDQGRDALVIRRMLEHGHMPTLGPWSSVGDFSRGPAFYYLLYLPFKLAGGHAAAAAALSAVADCCAIALLFLVGKAISTPWAGLVSAGLWAVAPLVLIFARMGWNPNPLPCLVLLTIYGLLRIARGDGRFLLLVVPAWSVAWQLHDQALLLLPLALSWFWLRPRLRLRHYAGAVIVTVLTLAPYIAGELQRGFANTRAMASYILSSLGGSGAAKRDRSRHIAEVVYNFDSLLPGSQGDWLHWTMRIVAVVGLLTLVGQIRAKEKRSGALLIALWLLVLPLYSLWPGASYYHYLLAGFPLPFLCIGLGADHLRRRCVAGRSTSPLFVIGWSVLIGAGAVAAFSNLRVSPPGTYHTAERVVDHIIADAGTAPFAFRYVGSWSYDETAYQYLFAYRGHPPTTGTGLPTYTVFSPRNQGDGPRYGGVTVGDVKIVRTDLEQPRAGLNLLLDERFLAHKQLPAPWYVIPPRPGWHVSVPAATHAETDINGQVALRLERPDADRPAVVEQQVAVSPGQRYQIRFDYRTGPQCNGLAESPVRLRIADRTGHVLLTIPDTPQASPPVSTGWTSTPFVATVPPTGTVLTVQLVSSCVDEIWFRNVELREVVSGTAAPQNAAGLPTQSGFVVWIQRWDIASSGHQRDARYRRRSTWPGGRRPPSWQRACGPMLSCYEWLHRTTSEARA